MDTQSYNQLVSFIWSIANDCLVDTYDVGDYRKVILPMTVIRRFDAILEDTKEVVIEEKKRLDKEGAPMLGFVTLQKKHFATVPPIR
jgi:type I restriction enzyme M protein